MKLLNSVKISNLEVLLEGGLSIEERGVLISLILAWKKGEKIPEICWLYFSKSVAVNSIRHQLVSLQDKGFIKYSHYSQHKSQIEIELITPQVKEVIEFSNNLWGKNRKLTKTLAEVITPRLTSHSVEEVKLVVSNRFEEWKDDPVMNKHLVLETICRPKNFNKYLDEANSSSKGVGRLKAHLNNLKAGDTMSLSNIKFLLEKDVYSMIEYSLLKGERFGLPKQINLKGVDIIKKIRADERARKRNREVETELIYNQ